MRRDNLSTAAIFGIPLVLGLFSLIGLVGALLADGLWDGIGAALLAVAFLVIARARFRRRR